MRKGFAILFMLLSLSVGCSKKNSAKTSGTVTIDNILYGSGPYYALGFSFSQAKEISTLSNPEPDVTINNDGTLLNLILQTNNYRNSFYKFGEYQDAGDAKAAFNSLTSVSVQDWIVWADFLKPDQIWIFRTGDEHYAKIRIISTISETRGTWNYAECTFEWAYQPDGSLTFPGK